MALSAMRISRKLLLPQDGGMIHKFWRAHNKEFLLEDHLVKNLYLQNTFRACKHKSVSGHVLVHAFCVMSNHVHESVSYTGSSQYLSKHMQISHSRFGNIFNKQHNRQGPVAYDRPKTPLIQTDGWHQMRVHFYIEANPLRAHMVRDLKMYKYSSYRFYAWGIKDEFTQKLSIPKWYLELGKNSKQRQAKYRALFDAYLKEMLLRPPNYTTTKFIGDPVWAFLQNKQFKELSHQRAAPS